jgi:hypothetical protein
MRGKRMKKKTRPVPKFRRERDEREFWSTHDTTDCLDFQVGRLEIEFDPVIEAPVKSISLRCPAICSINSRPWPIKRISLAVAHQS